MNMIVDFLKILIPPIDKDNPKVTVWRFIMVLGILFALGHIAVAKGLVRGISGYALASELVQVQTTLASIELNSAEQAIDRWHKRLCRAQTTNNLQARTIAQDELRKKLQEYLKLTGNQYIIFECDER